MPRELHPENLRVSTPEEARRNGALGGKKSAKVRKEKRLLSQIYAEILADKNGVDGEGKTLDKVISEILSDTHRMTTASRVSLIKEIREGTEGSKSQVTGLNGEPLIPQKIQIEFLDADTKA